MTVQDAANELFGWFESNDSFEISRDIKKIVPIMDNEEETFITFKIALEKLEEAQLVASKEYGEKKYYILEKHMDAFQQQVELGPWSAKFISSEINEFCGIVQDNTDLCQTSAISEKDVRNLVHIAQFYKQKLVEKEQIISQQILSKEGVIGDLEMLENFSLGPKIKKPKDEDNGEDKGEDEDSPEKKKKK